MNGVHTELTKRNQVRQAAARMAVAPSSLHERTRKAGDNGASVISLNLSLARPLLLLLLRRGDSIVYMICMYKLRLSTNFLCMIVFFSFSFFRDARASALLKDEVGGRHSMDGRHITYR